MIFLAKIAVIILHNVIGTVYSMDGGIIGAIPMDVKVEHIKMMLATVRNLIIRWETLIMISPSMS